MAHMERRADIPLFTPILIAGSLILLVSFAIRSAFGVFQIPIADEFGWLRSEFSLAIAIQNLAWGIGQPIFAAIAERFGTRLALVLGAITYAVGLVLSSFAVTPEAHQLFEILVGFGVAGTGFGVILAVVGRAAAPEHRSMALAITTAVGSVGQVVGPPVAEALLSVMSWQSVFLIFAAAIMSVLLLLPAMRAPDAPDASGGPGMGEALSRALRDPSYALIFIGFFSCGYQLGFITAHFPAFVTEACSAIPPGSLLANMGIATTSALGAAAIGVIGLFNIMGTLFAGWLGQRYSKKMILAAIYALRTMVAAAFIMSPMTPATVLLFAASMGALWLATVPVTSALVGQIYGMRFMGTLYGIVFFSHQVGSFLGVWLGGALYDTTGSYTLVWWIGIGVGAFSAIVHLPVREQPMEARAA